ncbi:TetR/AcrR family transcriptional regulator [Nonomuraea candida]|uniref:TetR/AcrR family transcriptional regulator n=1 Tax=Nonomuraea candida TaxID=359159 RepID=UPI000A030052|nr:TetR/AcrR family transcriptional regulator [Nonomuraea candida]
MPTGIHLQDPREQLFGAAEQILLQEGPNALTSRAVTARAGCAKGVLHRHFESFDAFVAEFVLDRIDRMRAQGAALRGTAGTGTVVGNLTDALTRLFGPLAVSIVTLVVFHDQVRVRLRAARPAGGLPVLGELAVILSDYLADEQKLGRLAAGADLGMLVPTLLGALHLRFAGADGPPPGADDIREVVSSVFATALTTTDRATADRATTDRATTDRATTD